MNNKPSSVDNPVRLEKRFIKKNHLAGHEVHIACYCPPMFKKTEIRDYIRRCIDFSDNNPSPKIAIFHANRYINWSQVKWKFRPSSIILISDGALEVKGKQVENIQQAVDVAGPNTPMLLISRTPLTADNKKRTQYLTTVLNDIATKKGADYSVSKYAQVTPLRDRRTHIRD